ncbi:hypothetical protein [Jiangella sp. DSM 45060]|uniref:hypothetical protein n=1 Tax=Jiangella sp. DSM 45060 TaxID=1798224 RepID=UPI00087BC058|nr:hypothetical protein [Jiangella sp. DSM 45060]SDS30753.1 hypothetical protein SAMN04515669_0802 [Jiangella sp. DSM 45060]
MNDTTRADLERLQIQVGRIIGDLKAALDGPLSIMASGEAWTGTRADGFGTSLDIHKSVLQKGADAIVADIAAAVSAAPAEEPPA